MFPGCPTERRQQMKDPAKEFEGHTTDAAAHPDRAIDDLEERVLGRRIDQVRDEDDDETAPAFEQDADGQPADRGPGTEPS
jgi:hypothetical protein